jgi:cardiolipin synthase
MIEDLINESSYAGWGTAVLLIFESAIRLLFVFILLGQKRTSSEARIAWILVILVFPLFGWLIYLLVGRAALGKTRVDLHKVVRDKVAASNCHPGLDPELSAMLELPLPQRQIASVAERVSGSEPLRGNTATLFGDTDVIVNSIIEDINKSVDHCHLIFYIWLDDQSGTRVGEALIRAKARGVNTRVLVDSVGSKRFLKSNLCHRMRESGVEIVGALPVNPIRALFHRIDLRNHRKIVVIDGMIAWTGSQNMADAAFALKPKFAPWIDCAIRLVGPAAKELQILFLEDWYLDTDELIMEELQRPCIADSHGVLAQVVASGPNYQTSAATELVQACIQIASEEITFTTPYFVPDSATIINLTVAAHRGVKVDIVVPKHNDSRLVALASRANYLALLEAGVHIHEFEGGLLHAKTISIDRDTALITSANLDRRSFNLNFEAGVLVFDTDFASQLRFLQQGYIDRSKQVDFKEWVNRGSIQRILENTAGLMSPLL